MHCRHCGYALWNLIEPRCPECGLAFDLRTYRFAPETVGFACPDCGHLHAGRDDNGLPATADVAVCEACARPMQVTRMPVVPLLPDPPAAIGSALPWDERAKLGWWKAWWKTTHMGMISPTQVPQQLHPGSTWGNSYLYAVVTYGLGMSINAGLLAIMVGIGWSNSAQSNPLIVWGVVLAILITAVLGYALLVPLVLWLFCAVPTHLILRLLAGERMGGFRDTARLVNYAQAPMALLAIPICGYHIGGNVGWIWAIVATILMVRAAHGVSGLKASLAVLGLPLAMLVLYIVGVVTWMAYLMPQP